MAGTFLRSLAVGLAFLSSACASLFRHSERQVRWECAPELDGMAGNIVEWARSLVTATDSDQVQARHSYGFSAVPADSVRVVTDSVACGRAGRAYLAGDRPLPGRHRVVLVSVGDRYIALDLNQNWTRWRVAIASIRRIAVSSSRATRTRRKKLLMPIVAATC